MVGRWPTGQDFSVSPRPLGTNWGFELGWTGLGLGLGGLGTKGLGPWLDNDNDIDNKVPADSY